MPFSGSLLRRRRRQIFEKLSTSGRRPKKVTTERFAVPCCQFSRSPTSPGRPKSRAAKGRGRRHSMPSIAHQQARPLGLPIQAFGGEEKSYFPASLGRSSSSNSSTSTRSSSSRISIARNRRITSSTIHHGSRASCNTNQIKQEPPKPQTGKTGNPKTPNRKNRKAQSTKQEKQENPKPKTGKTGKPKTQNRKNRKAQTRNRKNRKPQNTKQKTQESTKPKTGNTGTPQTPNRKNRKPRTQSSGSSTSGSIASFE